MNRLESIYYSLLGWAIATTWFVVSLVLIGLDGIFGEPRRRGPKQ